MPAQGSSGADYQPGTQPRGGFVLHQIVRIDCMPDSLYDPSYGSVTTKTDARSAERKYEDRYITDLATLIGNRIQWLPDDHTRLSLRFQP